MNASPLVLQSAKDAVTEEIRELIFKGELVSGERISIESLAARFGVSKTPIRDALFALRAEGLVQIVPRVGVFVNEITDQEVEDIYALKLAIEPIMMSWAAARGDAADRLRYFTSVSELERLAELGDSPAYVREIERRREDAIRLSKSEPLAAVLRSIDSRIRLLRARSLQFPQQFKQSARQQKKLAQAVRAGDAEMAYEVMRINISDAFERVKKLSKGEAQDGKPRSGVGKQHGTRPAKA